MKKLLFAAAIIALAGAGCAGSAPENVTGPEASPQVGSNAPAENMSRGSDAAGEMTAMPETAAGEVDGRSDWETKVMKSGVSFTYPIKGQYAPNWTYDILSADDSHLSGLCYETDATAYEKEGVTGLGGCQTATTVDGSAAGTRTDYFVYKSAGGRLNLFTVTKVFPAGFDMDKYGATLAAMFETIKE